jgi:small subunit ribosomal protein S16
LQRKGAKKKPIYRVVVQDEASATKGEVVEILGQYNTMAEPSVFEVDKEKTLAWIQKGAKPTVKVRILLGKAGILPPIDLAALPKRKPRAEQKAEAEAKAEGKKAEGKKEEGKAEAPAEEKKEAPKEEAKKEKVKAEEVKPPAEKAST